MVAQRRCTVVAGGVVEDVDPVAFRGPGPVENPRGFPR